MTVLRGAASRCRDAGIASAPARRRASRRDVELDRRVGVVVERRRRRTSTTIAHRRRARDRAASASRRDRGVARVGAHRRMQRDARRRPRRRADEHDAPSASSGQRRRAALGRRSSVEHVLERRAASGATNSGSCSGRGRAASRGAARLDAGTRRAELRAAASRRRRRSDRRPAAAAAATIVGCAAALRDRSAARRDRRRARRAARPSSGSAPRASSRAPSSRSPRAPAGSRDRGAPCVGGIDRIEHLHRERAHHAVALVRDAGRRASRRGSRRARRCRRGRRCRCGRRPARAPCTRACRTPCRRASAAARSAAPSTGCDLRDAEVDDLDEVGPAVALDEEDVLGLEIAVDDALVVRGAERARDLRRDPHRARRRERRAVAGSPRRASSPSTNSITEYVMPSGVVPKSVTSTMFGWPIRDAAFASCTNRRIVAVSRIDLALEHLDRERALDHRVARREHDAHAALADLALDEVAAVERLADELVVLALARLATRSSAPRILDADTRDRRLATADDRARSASRDRRDCVGVASSVLGGSTRSRRRHRRRPTTDRRLRRRRRARRAAYRRTDRSPARRTSAGTPGTGSCTQRLARSVVVQRGRGSTRRSRCSRATTRIGLPLNGIIATARPNSSFVLGLRVVERHRRRRVEHAGRRCRTRGRSTWPAVDAVDRRASG